MCSMHVWTPRVSCRRPPCHLQCLQEDVEERKEKSRAAPTIDAMDERKGSREQLNEVWSDIDAHYFSSLFFKVNNNWGSVLLLCRLKSIVKDGLLTFGTCCYRRSLPSQKCVKFYCSVHPLVTSHGRQHQMCWSHMCGWAAVQRFEPAVRSLYGYENWTTNLFGYTFGVMSAMFRHHPALNCSWLCWSNLLFRLFIVAER